MRQIGGRLTAVAVVVALGAGCLVGPTDARADGGAVRSPAVPFDVNGDGYADLVAGDPARSVEGHEYAGALHVIYGSASGLSAWGSQFLTQDSPGIEGSVTGWSFVGQSTTSADFDGDGYADVATRVGEDLLVIYGSRWGLSGRSRLIARVAREGAFGLSAQPMAAGDFDADGYSDLVVSNPGRETDLGAVQVLRGSRDGLTTRGSLTVHRGTPGVPGKRFPDDFFGDDVAVGDVSGDGFDDLVLTSNEVDGGGSIYLFRGSTDGVRVAGSTVLRARDAMVRGAELPLGQDVALAVADLDGDGFGDVVAGAPGCAAERQAGTCGAVFVFQGASSGLSAQRHQVFDKDTPGVPGSAHPEDGFGTSVAVGDLDGDGHVDLAVGAPSERVGPIAEAGAVTVLYGTADGLSGQRAQTWSQASAQVKGVPHSGELVGQGPIRVLDFGRGRYGDLAIHNPGDELRRRGGRRTAGSVNVLYGSRRGLTNVDQLWHANSPGLAGPPQGQGAFGSDCC